MKDIIVLSCALAVSLVSCTASYADCSDPGGDPVEMVAFDLDFDQNNAVEISTNESGWLVATVAGYSFYDLDFDLSVDDYGLVENYFLELPELDDIHSPSPGYVSKEYISPPLEPISPVKRE